MQLRTIIKVTRAPFFASLATSVLVGTAIAWYEGFFHLGYFLLTLAGIIIINAGLNMGNDYFDHRSGNDEANKHPTPFSGGSRTIQEGVLSARQVLVWSLLLYLVGIVLGLYLAWARGRTVLWLGVAGMSIAFFSSAPPFRLNYLGHGLGELATFVGSGPLIVLGSYYVQAQQITCEALWASIPMGLMGASLIWINEFPDYEADKAVGKNTLVVLLGRQRAIWGYIGLLVASYVLVIAGVAWGVLPATLLLTLLTLPLTYRAIQGIVRFHSNVPNLIPTCATTVLLYLANGLLLCLGYVIAKFS